MRFSELVSEKKYIAYCILIIVIHLYYPITLSYDSAHYLMLSDFIRQGTWNLWDPYRNVLYPLFLYVFQQLLGANQNALLAPMIFAHIVLFTVCAYFAINIPRIRGPFAKTGVLFLVFAFIAIDPLILGYSHVLLTEFSAATVAIVACLAAYKIYQHSLDVKFPCRETLFWTFFLVLLVPLAWHLKQPYIGAAYFPFLIACSISISKRSSAIKVVYFVTINIIIGILVLLSIVSWNLFLEKSGMPPKPERSIVRMMESNISPKIDNIQASPTIFGRQYLGRYFAISNFFQYDQLQDMVVEVPSLNRASDNRLYGFRMFDLYGQSNICPMPDDLFVYAKPFTMKYDPPVWINHLEQGMQKKSNFFFTATFLLLPITVLFSAVMFIKNRRDIYAFILISAGASFLNALVWAIMIPVDRYLFWGYPLNLLVWLIMFIELVSIFAQRISRHRASLAGGGLSGAPAQWRPARHRQSTAIAQG